MTGMREQEVMHCAWPDVNLTRSTVTVRYKPEFGFSPKNYREREIPIPAKLVKRLKVWKAKSDKTCGLVFPTAGCKPKLDFLDCLKGVRGTDEAGKRRIFGCTSSALRSPRGRYGQALICGRFSNGLDTPTWKAPCGT